MCIYVASELERFTRQIILPIFEKRRKNYDSLLHRLCPRAESAMTAYGSHDECVDLPTLTRSSFLDIPSDRVDRSF